MAEYDYGSAFGARYHEARRLSPQAESWIAEVRARKLRRWVSPSDRILEYGVGYGWNLASLNCREKFGFDLTPGLRTEVESKGIRFLSSEGEAMEKSFDVVLAHHVLEHVQHPASCLARLKKLLRAGGRLLLFVPFEREQKYRRYRMSDSAHHLYSWTPPTLSNLLAQASWTIEQLGLQRFRFDRRAAIISERLGGGRRLYNAIRAGALWVAPEYEIFAVAR